MILVSFFLLFMGAGALRGIAGGSANNIVLAGGYLHTQRGKYVTHKLNFSGT